MRVFRDAFAKRVDAAVAKDPSIMTTREGLNEASGNTEEYLEGLGIRKSDLRRLESWDLAKRGYLREKSGWLKRWILVQPNDTKNAPQKNGL